MTFYTMAFVIFFCALLMALHFTKSCSQQRNVLLVANIVFYGYWDIRFLTLLFFIILVCFVCAIEYKKNQKKIFYIIPIGICLVTLGICKYLNFFIDTFCRAFGFAQVGTLNIILPLGISFYLFQAISYILDVKNNKIESEKNFIKLATYISFFPQIVSGPIVKAHDFLPQLEYVHQIKKENVYTGIQLFALGLTKKVVFADHINIAVNAVYNAPKAYNNISILWAVIGYSLQIYCDFSGYSDMAIGIAKILDFDLGKNFDMPYLAKNPSEFWRRWHISLSSWFRDYVYIPLGGNQCGKIKTYRNLFLTMLLSGLWHGANWTFVVWGAVHGIGTVINKMIKDIYKSEHKKSKSIINILFVFSNCIFVSLLWVVFRAENLEQAVQIFSGLMRVDGITYVNVYVVACFIAICFAHIFAAVKNQGHAVLPNLNLDCFRGQFAFCTWVLLIIVFMYVGDSAFIYAQF